jgi:hypothetical protein
VKKRKQKKGGAIQKAPQSPATNLETGEKKNPGKINKKS